MTWRNSEQLAAIANDILDIERLESGKQWLHLIPLNVTQLLKLAIKMNSGLAEEHDVEMVE